MPKSISVFKIDPALFELEPVKNYLSAHPNLDIQGLSFISDRVVRIFFNSLNEETGRHYLDSDLIEF